MSEKEDEKKPILAESDSESESMMDSDDECSDGEESVDEELTTEQVMRKEMAEQENLSGHVWDDLKNSVWTSRYMCLMGAFIGFVMALQFTVTRTVRRAICSSPVHRHGMSCMICDPS